MPHMRVLHLMCHVNSDDERSEQARQMSPFIFDCLRPGLCTLTSLEKLCLEITARQRAGVISGVFGSERGNIKVALLRAVRSLRCPATLHELTAAARDTHIPDLCVFEFTEELARSLRVAAPCLHTLRLPYTTLSAAATVALGSYLRSLP